MSFFKKRRMQFLTLFFETLCAKDSRIVDIVDLKNIALKVDTYIQTLPWRFFIPIRFLFFLFEFMAFFKYLLPFSKLSFKKRQAYLMSWSDSSWYLKRSCIRFITLICYGHLYSDETLLTSLGYKNALTHRRTHVC